MRIVSFMSRRRLRNAQLRQLRRQIRQKYREAIAAASSRAKKRELKAQLVEEIELGTQHLLAEDRFQSPSDV